MGEIKSEMSRALAAESELEEENWEDQVPTYEQLKKTYTIVSLLYSHFIPK